MAIPVWSAGALTSNKTILSEVGVFALLDKNYEKLEAKASYSGLMKWLKIDYRNVLIYKKA